jgi:hypothetical protein
MALHGKRKWTTRGAALLGAAMFGVAMAVSPAAAATTSADQQFSFSPFDQSPTANCTVHIQLDFPYNGAANTARAVTSVSGSSSACTSGVETTVAFEYRNTNGVFVSKPYTFAYGTSVTKTYTDVKSDVTSYHQVFFPQCGCATDVYTLTVPNPK